MRHDIRAALRALVVPTAALAAVLAFAPGRIELAVRVYALLVCAVALLVALAALRRSYPPIRALRHTAAHDEAERLPPPGLGRMENEVALALASAFDLHYRLVPRLRSIASGLLRSRRGVSLEAEPSAARARLGDEAFALVRLDRSAPEDRLARGIPEASLRHVVDSLERL